MITTLVLGLLLASRPTAILGGIIFVVIYSVNRGILLTKSLVMMKIAVIHRISKLLESLPSTFYSLPSIIRVVRATFIVATISYTVVQPPKGSIRHSVSERVSVSSSIMSHILV